MAATGCRFVPHPKGEVSNFKFQISNLSLAGYTMAATGLPFLFYHLQPATCNLQLLRVDHLSEFSV
jgi:hypothetical protein